MVEKFGEIRSALKKNRELAANPGQDNQYRTFEHEWNTYDSGLEQDYVHGDDRSIGKTFSPLLPSEYIQEDGSYRFKDYIQETLGHSEDWRTAVEFGGPGSALFSGFDREFFNATTGVCLKDIRPQEIVEADSRRHHTVIEGDIADPVSFFDTLYPRLTDKLGTKKFDLIVSRMRGPLQFIEKNPMLLERTVQNWYNILHENGLMFIQYEHEPENNDLRERVEAWAANIMQAYPEIDIETDIHNHSRVEGILRLHKRRGAPETLPFIKKS